MRMRAVRVEQQAEYAEEVADGLDECGHDEISSLDLLDVLASAGLALVRAPGVASHAYLTELASD